LVLSGDSIQEILNSAMETQFSRVRPASRQFFNFRLTAEEQKRPVSFHKWAIADIQDSDTVEVVRHLANTAVKEAVATTAMKITGELVFNVPEILPSPPLWEDRAPLFSARSMIDNSPRFGVEGGNIVDSVGCHVNDVANAAERLSDLDVGYDGNERLQLFCAKPLEKELILASARANAPCRIFGLYKYKNKRSWVLTRDTSACSAFIGLPTLMLPIRGNKLAVGARFVVWIHNPRFAVCVQP
jgi:hypothetical protein